MALNNLIKDPNKNISNGVTNGIPEYQKFIPYAQLYVVKNNEVEGLFNQNGFVDIRGTGTGREVISFLGYNQDTGLFSNAYTDDLTGELIRADGDEGFGITNIEVDIKSKFVPTVSITFVDVKGSSLLNEEAKRTSINSTSNGSSYASIFQLPPPTFVLIMKGAFGKAVRYVLHLLSHDVTFNSSSGNFEIRAKLVGKTFAPLSDIKMGWIKAAPYIGNEKLINGDLLENIDHFLDLTMIGGQLYDKLNKLTSSSKEVKSIKQLNDDLSTLNDLSKELLDTTALELNIKPIFVNPGTISGRQIVITGNGYPVVLPDAPTEKSNRIFQQFTLPFNQSDLDNLVQLNKFIQPKKTTLLADPDYKRIIGDINFSESDLLVEYRYGLTDSNVDKTDQINVFFDITDYQSKIDNAKKNIVIQIQDLEKTLKANVNQTVQESLGFQPNIENIMKILCDDIDIFFNQLKQAGLQSGTKNSTVAVSTNPSDTLRVLDAAAWPRVTMKVTEGTVTREVAIYPGADELKNLGFDFSGWGEVQFVEDFCKAYFRIKTFEKEFDEMNKTENDGTKKIIPISPLDTEVLGTSSPDLSYIGKSGVKDIIITMLKRYFLGTQFTYKGFWNVEGFWGDDEAAKDDLLKFLANAEAQNIASSVVDDKTINALITTLETSPADFISGLKTSPEYKSDPFLNGTEGFSDNNKTFTLSNGTKYYSYKDNDNYQGLKVYEDFNPQTDIIDTSLIESSEKPTKYLIDFVNGGFFSKFFKKEGEIPKLNKENLLVFTDVRKSADQYASDFFQSDSAFSFDVGRGNTVSSYVKHFKDLNEELENNPITDLTTFREDLFTTQLIRLGSAYSDISGKFKYPGIIEMPKFYLVGVGYYIQKNKDAGEIIDYTYLSDDEEEFYFSKDDEQFYLNFYQEYLSKEQDLLKSFNSVVPVIDYKEENVKASDIMKYLMEPVYVVNNTAFTYLSTSDSDKLKDTSGLDLTIFHPLFEKNRLNRVQQFYDVLRTQLNVLLSEKKKKNDALKKDITRSLRDSNIKTQLYYSFKSIYERWITGTEDFKPSNFAYPFNGGTSLFEKFKFIDRGYNPIGDKMIIDFQDLINYANNSDSEVYGGISSFLSKNQFDFFPLPNFIDFTNKKDAWLNAFNTEETAKIETQPVFTCMYVGGFSSQKDDVVSFNNETMIPSDMGDNIYAFNVNFGTQAQTIFKDIQLSTNEIKETGESLKLMDDIFRNLGDKETTPTPKGQSLFEVYENRSYSSTITIPFGNLLIQPTQYYELNNIPLFNGVYIILEVNHKMSAESNRIETTFKGSRIKRYISPIVTDVVANVLGTYTELSTLSNSVTQNTTTAQNTVLTINPADFLIRKPDKTSVSVVRKLTTGEYVNDSRYLVFTSNSIDKSKVSVVPTTKQ